MTQRITERYIIDKIGFDPAKIEHIFGGVFESRLPFNLPITTNPSTQGMEHADRLSCVAHKYAGNLTSKGYDQFVAIAMELAGAFIPNFASTWSEIICPKMFR